MRSPGMVFPFFASFVSPKALVWIATAFSRNYNRSGRSTEKLIITGIVLILYINNFFNFRLLTWVGREWNSFVAAEGRRFRGVCFSSSLSTPDIVAFVFVSRGPIRSRSRFFFPLFRCPLSRRVDSRLSASTFSRWN